MSVQSVHPGGILALIRSTCPTGSFSVAFKPDKPCRFEIGGLFLTALYSSGVSFSITWKAEKSCGYRRMGTSPNALLS